MNTIGESIGLQDEPWFQKSLQRSTPPGGCRCRRKAIHAAVANVRQAFLWLVRSNAPWHYRHRSVRGSAESVLHPVWRITVQKVLLLDEEGMVLFDSHGNEWTGSPLPSPKFLQHMSRRAQGEGSQTVDIGGSKYLATYVRMDSYPWAIANLTPLSELTGSIGKIDRLLIIFLVVYLICCIGVVLYITAYFTQPIARLVRYMRRLEAGKSPSAYSGIVASG